MESLIMQVMDHLGRMFLPCKIQQQFTVCKSDMTFCSQLVICGQLVTPGFSLEYHSWHSGMAWVSEIHKIDSGTITLRLKVFRLILREFTSITICFPWKDTILITSITTSHTSLISCPPSWLRLDYHLMFSGESKKESVLKMYIYTSCFHRFNTPIMYSRLLTYHLREASF